MNRINKWYYLILVECFIELSYKFLHNGYNSNKFFMQDYISNNFVGDIRILDVCLGILIFIIGFLVIIYKYYISGSYDYERKTLKFGISCIFIPIIFSILLSFM